MLKKIKEQRGKDKVGTEMLPPPSPLPSIPAIKIESVQSIKETRNENEDLKNQLQIYLDEVLINQEERGGSTYHRE